MKIKELYIKFRDILFNKKWRCLACGKEIFDGEYFCKECKDSLPFNEDAICDHCGRKLNYGANYCTTCKGKLVSVDKARSAFVYKNPISKLIKKAKYDNAKYVLEAFAERLSYVYLKNCFNADIITYIPMTDKALKKRGYNQSEILAEKVSEIVGVPTAGVVVKTRETKRQATLGQTERLKNLSGAFKVADRKFVKDKSVLIVDDVTTTGSTAETVANKLKRAGASAVYLLTVASVPPKNGY